MRMITLIASSGIAKKWYSGKNRRCVPYDCVASAIGRILLVPMRIARASMHSSPPRRNRRDGDPDFRRRSAAHRRIRQLRVGRVLQHVQLVAIRGARTDGVVEVAAARVREPIQE